MRVISLSLANALTSSKRVPTTDCYLRETTATRYCSVACMRVGQQRLYAYSRSVLDIPRLFHQDYCLRVCGLSIGRSPRPVVCYFKLCNRQSLFPVKNKCSMQPDKRALEDFFPGLLRIDTANATRPCRIYDTAKSNPYLLLYGPRQPL